MPNQETVDALRETIAALRTQVADLKQWHAEDRATIAELRKEQLEFLKKPSPETAAALLMRERHALDRLRTLVFAWAEQVKDLAPRIGLRALEGLPDEVRQVLEKDRAVDPTRLER
jgi:hypothetical protein